ncbi:MAG: hypothetical protein IT326_04360 [Anaerolineae bacterium]|nr:hypothetical protein [Anaerolineae bacterium]
MTRTRYITLALLILLAFLALRWASLWALPPFVDEVNGINWSRDILIGYPFEALPHARWLDTAIWSLFEPRGPQTLFVTRGVTALLAAFSCAAAIALGRAVARRRAGLLAGLAYLLLPASAFFDRQALSDPLMAVFGALLLVVSLWLARRIEPPRRSVLSLMALAGLLLAAAILTKFSGAFYALAPALAVLLLTPPRGWPRGAAAVVGLGLLAGALVLAVFLIADRYLEPYQSIVNPGYNWSWREAAGASADSAAGERVRYLGSQVALKLSYYITPPMLIAVLASLAAFTWPHGDRRPLLWLWLAGLGPFAALTLVVGVLPGRYLTFAALPLAALAGVGLAALWRVRALPGWGRTALIALALLWPAVLSLGLTFRPEATAVAPLNPMPPDEYLDYVSSSASRGGMLPRLRRDLLALYARQDSPLHLVYSGPIDRDLQMIWGGYTGMLIAYDGSPDQEAQIARWLADGGRVAFVGGLTQPAAPYGAVLTDVAEYAGPEAAYHLRLLRDPGASLRFAMFREVFGDPFALEPDYRALAAHPAIGSGPVLVYPPHQADVLVPLLGERVIPLAADWPLELAEVEASVSQARTGNPRLAVIFWNEGAGDPDRRVESWLNTHLYRLREEWVGPLRVVTYAAPPSEPALMESGVGFGGLMRLERAGYALLDAAGEQAVVLRLEWRAIATISASYKTVTFIQDEEGQTLTQSDLVPVAFLRPTASWAVDEQIIDQYAVPLPAGLPAGTYTIRLGVYDEATLIRLPLETEGAPDTLVLGTFVVTQD